MPIADPRIREMYQRIRERRERVYRETKAMRPQLFERAIRAAEAITLNHDLPQKVTVEIEWACVASLADGLGISSSGI